MSMQTPNTWQIEQSNKKYLIVSLLVVSLLYIKTIYWMLGSWIMNPYYSHGFFVLAISIYLAYRNYKKYMKLQPLPDKNVGMYENIGLAVIAAAIIVHTFASLNQYLWISAVSYPFAVFGIVMISYKDLAKKLAFPIFFILLAVPYPIYGIANTLEIFSATSSVFITRLIGIKTTLVGAEIITAGGKFMVGAPCSGVRSILAMLTVISLYVYLIDECLKAKAVLILLSVPLALLANILRIASVVIAANYFGLGIAMGFVHTASDLVLFVLAVLLLIALRGVVSRFCE